MEVLQANNSLNFNLFDENEYIDDEGFNFPLKDILEQIIYMPDIVKNKYIHKQLKIIVERMN
jgi:hypothetical protein